MQILVEGVQAVQSTRGRGIILNFDPRQFYQKGIYLDVPVQACTVSAFQSEDSHLLVKRRICLKKMLNEFDINFMA